MKFKRLSASLLSLFALAALWSSTGCTKKDDKGKSQIAMADGKKAPEGMKELDPKGKHDAWWCQEHGVPEDLCSLCSDEVAAKFRKEGDWCKIHDRAQSQCFKCDPSKYKKFEDMYVAKYNKKPERPPEEEFKK
jgi:hypothetical protein